MTRALCIALLALGIFAGSYLARFAEKQPDDSKRLRIQQAYGQLPLSFQANRGQVDPEVTFLARSSAGNVLLTSRGAVLGDGSAFFKMTLAGSNASAQPVGLEELVGRANYFIGNEPSKWLTDIPTFRKVKYSGVYSGVDLVYYGNQRQLEYDFVLCRQRARRGPLSAASARSSDPPADFNAVLRPSRLRVQAAGLIRSSTTAGAG